ncbi:inactive dipeptidyl peptidase 10-like isoform X2 [Rhodnius prolixus]|uniref:inactive dipeptidyl peptidase 10-like isoform X2 n=1 Tax=Rhodnius prolixus TaxID=13249 RepID=UPI003D18DB03
MSEGHDEKRKKKVVVISPKDTEELVSNSGVQRNWRGVLIALVVVLIVLSLIVVSTLILTPADTQPRITGSKISLADIRRWTNNATWARGSDVLFRNSLGGISIYNADENLVKELISNSTFRQLNAVDFKVSTDYKYVLFITESKKVYSYTTEAYYHIYEIATKVRFPVAPLKNDFPEKQYELQRVEFGTKGNGYAFVYKNDIYYSKGARETKVIRLTDTGSDWIYNGIPDWIYQEEIFKSDEAFWFSPDSNYILYATFNDTDVGKISLTKFSSKENYPKMQTVSYPKPGTKNPEVKLTIIDLEGDFNKTEVPIPKTLTNSSPYMTYVKWLSDSDFISIWMNRRQNVSIFYRCTLPQMDCNEEYTHVMQGFVHPRPDVLTSRPLVTVLPVLDGQNGYYPQVVTITEGVVVPLTQGQNSVTRLLATYEGYIYFEAAPHGKPTQRHLYKVMNSINLTLTQHCLTCPTHYGNTTSDLALATNSSDFDSWPVKSTDCLFTRSSFNTDSRYYIIECLGPDVPTVHVMSTANNSKIFTLESNTLLKEKYNSLASPQIKLFQAELEGGYHAQVKLQLPPGLREYEDMTFPLVLKVSYKPGEQSVSQKWSMDYTSYLASKRNFIVAEIDCRGSANSGMSHMNEARLKLGNVDALDQMAVISYLRDNLKFVDKKRIGIFGEGYGGFLTTMILAQDTNIFKCGVAISGIYSWSHYNSVWTERWLATADVTDNYRGYEECDVTKRAGNIKEGSLTVVHGTGDLGVHYHHAMLMSSTLVQAGILFNQISYPDEGHGLEGVSSHLHKVLDQVWDNCFGVLDYTEWEQGTSYFSFKS